MNDRYLMPTRGPPDMLGVTASPLIKVGGVFLYLRPVLHRRPVILEAIMKHVLSCSYGKDSVATALLALQKNESLDELVYCEVMFSDTISGELPEHTKFIHETAIPYLMRTVSLHGY